MTIKVLVVDDSAFFRRRVCDIINADGRMEVIGMAENGKDAVRLNEELKPDVITMDYEMPVMDGITAVKHIMLNRPTPVLMFSSLTFEGARVTLNALEAGAVDFLPKSFEAEAGSPAQMRRIFSDKIVAVARSNSVRTLVKTTLSTPTLSTARESLRGISIVVIGTSTGGPAALQSIFKVLPPEFKIPIVIVQHMPASFTKTFAERLNQFSHLTIKEAVNGEPLQSGHAYVAPGGMQLMVDGREGGTFQIRESDDRINYRPSVDLAFGSVANHFGRRALGIVLTGMGADGRDGARLLKQAGGHIWTQDEQSSVIYGMPSAVERAGLSDRTVSLNDLPMQLAQDVHS
ncbi:MAG: chemotaxis response regulator protein-glutamate methylesterase [Oleibacter sp.]|nr:chemotaxis response regulator protein-glutamate methylesterase [Thalassolituus sp.]